jgi:protease YdgD
MKPTCSWRAPAASIVVFQLIVFGATEHDGAFAQRASSGLKTGILGDKDHRVLIPSDQWPWSSIGRINIIAGTARGLCTGTLIAPRRILTAAQCLFDDGINDWVKPGSVHFLVGQARDKFLGHSIAESFIKSPKFAHRLEDRPRYDMIDRTMLRHNWAILTLRHDLPVKPIPILAIESSNGIVGEVALAGYASDREYVLSGHKGCAATIETSDPGIITHMCDTVGQSGAPILLLNEGAAKVIGIHSSIVQQFEPRVGYKALRGEGVSAVEFEQAAISVQP